MAEKFTIQTQIEHLQMKYSGTGHADQTKFEWVTNHHRDTYASFVSHEPLNMFYSIMNNEATGRSRYNFLQKMVQPCGPNPNRDEED